MQGERTRAARRRRRRRLTLVLTMVLVLGLAGYVAYARLAEAGEVHTGDDGAHGATVLRWRLHSRFVHATLPVTAAEPPGGGGGRPLLVFLHGRGRNGNESNANSAFFAALAAQGARAPDVVFPDGADHSYWHARRSGRWDRYVLDEVIPQAVARLHADPKRIAIGGISMGGFGAFDLARRRPKLFCAVGGHSAALWLTAGATAPGAFDDGADFARHDVIATARAHGRAPWGSAQLWLDGGTTDPFRQAGEALATALHLRMRHWRGGHDGSYWSAHYAAYLRFYATALARC
ncbi:MAG: putative esterase [Solirubrobacterales bacterium]|nr:putative esterase [Solirubrobacterales bacterium]